MGVMIEDRRLATKQLDCCAMARCTVKTLAGSPVFRQYKEYGMRRDDKKFIEVYGCQTYPNK